MAEIRVAARAESGGWRCDVEVREGGSSTRHDVVVSRADLDRLAPGGDVRLLVHRSFEFLLARESKESILPRFEISVIGRYFPEYERTIRGS